MTSRFAPEAVSYLCLNGPKAGEYVDAPAGVTVERGSATAVPWFDAKALLRYCVYVLVEHNGQDGLMFVKTHDSTRSAEEHVHRIAAAMQMAKDTAARN